MSRQIKFAAAALAVGIVTSFIATPAAAACDGTVHHGWGGSVRCYYLPTVSNGRVTGVEKHLSFQPNSDRPGGAVIGAAKPPVVRGGGTR